MKSIYIYLLCFLAGIALTILASVALNCNNDKPRQSGTIVMTDTLTLERYNQRVDTIQNNIIKTIWQNQKDPEVIIQEKITYKEIEKFKDYDLALGFEKRGTTLKIWAVNMNDSLIKEQVFEDVFGNFEAWSANDRIVVKSNKFRISSNVYVDAKLPINKINKSFYDNLNYTAGVEGVLNYKEKIDLKLGVEHNFNLKDTQIKLGVGYKIF